MATDPEFEPAKFIYLDLFPATVTRIADPAEGEQEPIVKEARVIVTNAHIYAILDHIDGPYFVLKEEVVSFEIIPKKGFMVAGANNDYFIERDGNCGCGTKLRGKRFLVGVPHISRLPKKR